MNFLDISRSGGQYNPQQLMKKSRRTFLLGIFLRNEVGATLTSPDLSF